MNLDAKTSAMVLLGGLIFSGFGWLISFAFNPGLLPGIEDVIGLRGAGLLFGGIVGMALTLIVIVARASYDPKAESARNFSQVNGWGSMLIGKHDQREDGSYVTTEWFTIFYLPIFPVCRYRLTKSSDSNFFHSKYQIQEKLPPRFTDVKWVYGAIIVALIVISGMVCLIAKSLE